MFEDIKLAVREAAHELIKEKGLINLSRVELCERAGIPDGSFSNVMGCTFAKFVKHLKTQMTCIETHKVTKTRTDPELRKDQILSVAVELSKEFGYNQITRRMVADKANVSEALVSKYFNTMKQLRRVIMRFAVKQEIIIIIAQGLGCSDTHAKKASPELKAKAIKLISEC